MGIWEFGGEAESIHVSLLHRWVEMCRDIEESIIGSNCESRLIRSQ